MTRPHRTTPSPRHLALAVALLLAGPLAAPAFAQSEAPGTVQASTRNYDIAPGTLAGTLNRIARDAGLTITFDASMAAGLSAPAVRGRMGPEQALRHALSETDLQLVRTGAGSYTLRAHNPTALAPITVRGQGERGLGPVEGYIARRSVTATKADIPLIETAQSVNVVTADQIEIQNAETLHQALRYTPGVQPMGSDSTTSDGMIIRGFNVTGAAPMYLNGTKLSRNTFSGVSEPYAMERIELLKGPASVLYGNAAPGGIINMVTKQPQAEPLRELKFQLGSFDRKQVAGDFAGKLDDEGALTYRVTGLMRRSDTSVEHIHDDRNFGSAALRWDAGQGTSITLLANHQRNDTVFNYGLPFAGTAQRNPNGRIDRDRFTGEPGFNRFETDNTTVGYLLSHDINDTFTFRQNLLHYRGNTDYADIGFGALDATQRFVSRSAYTRADEDRSWPIDNQLEAKWASGRVEHTSLVGVDYTKSRFKRVQYNGTVADLDLYAPVYGSPVTLNPTPSQNLQDESRQLGVYAQQHMKFDERWVLTLGGRYDKVKATRDNHVTGVSGTTYDDDAFTGRVGVVRLFENGWAPYVSYAQSFEPSSGSTATGQPFKPTEGEQYEVGVRYQPPGTSHSITASVYELTQQNVTTAHPTLAGQFVQEGEVRSRGLELEARAHLRHDLNVIASYGYIDNAVTKSNSGTEGNRFGGVPRHTAAVWVDYAINDALGVGGGVRHYGSSKNLANTVDVKGHTVVDAVLNYRFAPEWQLALNLNNLFDERYVTCSYACFYGTPRSATATVSYRW